MNWFIFQTGMKPRVNLQVYRELSCVLSYKADDAFSHLPMFAIFLTENIYFHDMLISIIVFNARKDQRTVLSLFFILSAMK